MCEGGGTLDDSMASLSVPDLNPHRSLTVKILCSKASSVILSQFLTHFQIGYFAFACVSLTWRLHRRGRDQSPSIAVTWTLSYMD